MSVFYLPLALLLASYCSPLTSSKITVHVDFVVPGSDELISTKLSMQSPQITFYKTIRTVLHIHSIIMDCTFTFDTSYVNHNRALTCDTDTACISPSSTADASLLHFENLGTGDLDIKEITKSDEILFYDDMVCIGDSTACDGHRYIDFTLHPVTNNVQISHPSQSHETLRCNPKDTVYSQNAVPDLPPPSGSTRKLLRIHDDIYGDFNYHQNTYQVVSHGHYMDIILTMIFLILIVVSMFNMSYAFHHFKSTTPKRHYSVDTRRV
eukprot:121272_1